MIVATPTQSLPFGALMRQWRKHRRFSQLDLAHRAEVSARHLSFIETGRSAPSKAMVLRLAAALDVPAREQNRMLVAAGLAPIFAERDLDDPELESIREGVARVLDAYDPFPCLAVDRAWNILRANAGAQLLLAGVDPQLLQRPNALRLALHPEGLAPRIRNLAQWRHHVLERLRREVATSASAELSDLLSELQSYPGGDAGQQAFGGVVVPLIVETVAGQRLSFLSTVTVFGTALDLTVAELSIEAFLPADEATAAALR